MPTTYLPLVRQHSVVVIRDLTAEHGNRFHVIDWNDRTPRRREMLAGKPESLIDLWEREIIASDRLADWKFEHTYDENSVISVATAQPAYLTTAERIDMLLSQIFRHSCSAAKRDDWDRVAYWDDRYSRIETAYYGTPV
jgi:hypothetical protein